MYSCPSDKIILRSSLLSFYLPNLCQRSLQSCQSIFLLINLCTATNRWKHWIRTLLYNFHRREGLMWPDPNEENGATATHLLRLSSFVLWFVSSPIASTRNLVKGREREHWNQICCDLLWFCISHEAQRLMSTTANEASAGPAQGTVCWAAPSTRVRQEKNCPDPSPLKYLLTRR